MLLLLLGNVSRSGSSCASISLPSSGDAFAVEALLLAEAVQEPDDDLADLGQMSLEGRLARLVGQACLETDS